MLPRDLIKIFFLIHIFFTTLAFAVEEMAWPKEQWMTTVEFLQLRPEQQVGASWKPFLKLTFMDSQTANFRAHCIHLKKPIENQVELQIVEIPPHLSCPEAEPKGELILAAKVGHFSWEEKNDGLKFTYSDEKRAGKNITIKFLNKEFRSRPVLFHSSAPRRVIKGLFFLSPSLHKENEASTIQPRLNGEFEDRLVNKTAQVCRQVTNECVLVGQDECHLCRYGWFEVPNGCAKEKLKFCGVDRCGKKGEPACLRGYRYQRSRLAKMDCTVDDSFAFCEQGLSIQCEGHLAICL